MTTPMQLKFDRYQVTWLFIKELDVHPKIQRPFIPKHAQDIADNFDPDAFKPLDVVQSRARYLVFEGQHRLAAARIALGEDQRVPCHVHEECPLEDQARIALAQRRSKAWTKIDQWAVRVIAKEEIPLKIEAVLVRHGLKVVRTIAPGVVQAVATLELIWTRYGGEVTLERVLNILG